MKETEEMIVPFKSISIYQEEIYRIRPYIHTFRHALNSITGGLIGSNLYWQKNISYKCLKVWHAFDDDKCFDRTLDKYLMHRGSDNINMNLRRCLFYSVTLTWEKILFNPYYVLHSRAYLFIVRIRLIIVGHTVQRHVWTSKWSWLESRMTEL